MQLNTKIAHIALACLFLLGFLMGVWAQRPEQVKIAFYSNRDGNYEIYVMDADGNNQRNLTKNPSDDMYPAWSPDGKMIAFMSNRDGNNEIYVMDTDGNNQRRLTNNPAEDKWPSWFDPDVARSIFPAGNLGITWGKIKQNH
jgi:dipeptidyl aminopeptidase/acylaminoacyl peptidase